MKPVIRFKGYEIEKISYTRGEIPPDVTKDMSIDDDGNALGIAVKTGISEDHSMGLVSFLINIVKPSSDLHLNVEISGHFELSESLETEEIDDFLSVNGTAILFPYVRSIISIISTLDSNDAIILPTINTQIFRDLDINK